jgi:hypothetical protein
LTKQLPDRGSQFDCEIKFRNHLDNCWRVWFEGLSVKDLTDGEVLVTGSLPDQPALFGLLNKIRDLNLKVISLSVIKRTIYSP